MKLWLLYPQVDGVAGRLANMNMLYLLMNVIITCKFCHTVFPAVIIRRIEKMEQQSNKQSQSHLVILLSQVFVLYFIFVPISSILVNSLLQLLLTDRNSQTFHPFSVHFLITEVDQLFIILGDIVFHCFVSSTPLCH